MYKVLIEPNLITIDDNTFSMKDKTKYNKNNSIEYKKNSKQINESKLFYIEQCEKKIQLTNSKTLHIDTDNNAIVMENEYKEHYNYILYAENATFDSNKPIGSHIFEDDFNYYIDLLKQKEFDIINISECYTNKFEVLFKINTDKTYRIINLTASI